MKKQLKALELDPKKTYLILVSKETGITSEELARFPESEGKRIFLFVDDINQIKVEEVEDLQMFVDSMREKIQSS